MPIQITNLKLHGHSHGDQGEDSPIVGIDLGTTNSLVAYVRNGLPEVLSGESGRRLIPSVISVTGGKTEIGWEAKRRKVREARNTAFSVKRLLGKSAADMAPLAASLPYPLEPGDDPKALARVRIGGRSYTAIELSAMILREARSVAERALGTSVTRAVITVPAYFNDSQRQATRAAGRLAGLDVLRIVNEPTAAALAYGLDRKREGLIAVYDLGGGTFDVSILKLHEGIFQVLATHGDTSLGGDDLDAAIVEATAREIQAKTGIDPRADLESRAALVEAAEALKIALSTKDRAVLEVTVAGAGPYSREWGLEEFERLARPVLERTRGPALAALADAGLKPEQLSDVVLVGGPTRLRVVQGMARDIFGREPNTSMHPDEVVALGAAIQADILAGKNRDLLLLDVVPLSLGLETYGGIMSPLIPRNTRIPTVARETFTTFVDNQTAVDVHVLQGERERVADNRSLARFKLRLKPMPAGYPRVEVTFLIDADGILQVAAKDEHTGNEQAVEVRPSYGLTDAEVERMLAESLEHAGEDRLVRELTEARNKAEPVLRTTEKKLPDARRLEKAGRLDSTELARVEAALAGLKSAMAGESPARVDEAARELNQATVRLAELLLQEAIEQASGGGAG